MKTYKNKVLKRIRGKRRGWVFTPKDFLDIAPRNTIDQILFRLAKQGVIRKVDRGVYDFPVAHKKLGVLGPSLDKLVKTVAKQTNDIVLPSGATIVNQLGLDTQVPAKPIYLTSGQSKQKHIQNYTIRLKHSKIVSQFGANQNLCRLVLALQHIGKDHINKTIINKCSRLLSNKDKKDLVKVIPKLPHWMAPFIFKITRDCHGKVSQS